MSTDRLLARVTLPADPATVPALQGLMMQAARGCVDHPDDLPALGRLVEEVALHVIRTAFDPGEHGEYTAELVKRPDQLVFAIEDKGLPAPYNAGGVDAANGARAGFQPFLPANLADRVAFRNLGRGGKRLEVARSLSTPPGAAPPDAPVPDEAEPPRALDEVTLRLLDAEDAPSLSRLMYRSYGYTYGSEFVYYPERIVAMLASGKLVSLIAVNESGDVVGHLAMLLHGPDSTTGETAMAAVDPRYRGRRLFERMKDEMRDLARNRRYFGLFSEAVAVHTFTQKGNLALGGFETGFLLAFTPATQVFRKISDGPVADRRSAVLFYLRTNDEPDRVIHAPSHHRVMVDAIIQRGGMNRRIAVPDPHLTLHSLRGRDAALDVAARQDVGRAFLTVRAYGADVLRRVQEELRTLCRHGYACVYLELPLSDPMTALLCKGFEAFGFFFAGVLFEVEGGDALRLQYLNGAAINEEDIKVASPFGRDLLSYVLAAKNEVDWARQERRRLVSPRGGATARARRRADSDQAQPAAIAPVQAKAAELV
ncbi:hypothetical protein [Azospirillum griseum]|uniref:N-acetyltransferase domain-containing protein n=1 Tax=Azospirillum griseum TaxID=2496639 RepID=A0A431VBQ5_9PROT|nr:hypothetical protein [Azospirillum griseum]RTR15934.1 hypothetical protein EJ903_21990 [Azospirillum griseum]